MQENFVKNKIPVDKNITQEELLEELRQITWEEILAIPLTGRFTGMFKTFAEMKKFIPKERNDGGLENSEAISNRMGSEDKSSSRQ